MQITFASNHGDIGGGEVMLMAMAHAARESGHEVTIVAPDTPPAVVDQARDEGFATVAIRADTTADYLRQLRRWDRACREGLLWCNGLRPALATAGRPRRVVHLHQAPLRAQRVAAQVARVGALAVVVPSRSMAEAIGGATPMWNWSADIAGVEPRRDTDPYVIGYLGRLSTDKGVPVLLEALRLLEARTPGRFRLLLAGESRFVDPDQARAIDRAIAAAGPAVHHAGWMERDAYFCAVNLSVFPSVWAEPFGLVVSEAMAARAPFVISDAGALPEVAGPGHPWIARRADPHDLARVIATAADADPGPVVDALHTRWQEEFSPAAGRRRLDALLHSLEEDLR